MRKLYRTAVHINGQNIYGEWTEDSQLVHREVSKGLVDEPKVTRWVETQRESYGHEPHERMDFIYNTVPEYYTAPIPVLEATGGSLIHNLYKDQIATT